MLEALKKVLGKELTPQENIEIAQRKIARILLKHNVSIQTSAQLITNPPAKEETPHEQPTSAK